MPRRRQNHDLAWSFFLGRLFVPQLRSTPANPHPLVSALVQAVVGALL